MAATTFFATSTAAYQPLEGYDGPVDNTWREMINPMQALFENFDTEKTHFSVWLRPPSPRMQYGVKLTRALIGEIQALVETKDGRLLVFETNPPLRSDGKEHVFRFGGKLYRASESQIATTVEELKPGIDWLSIPITVDDWKVSEQDTHLSSAANDEAMRRLALEMLPRLTAPARRPQ